DVVVAESPVEVADWGADPPDRPDHVERSGEDRHERRGDGRWLTQVIDHAPVRVVPVVDATGINHEVVALLDHPPSGDRMADRHAADDGQLVQGGWLSASPGHSGHHLRPGLKLGHARVQDLTQVPDSDVADFGGRLYIRDLRG